MALQHLTPDDRDLFRKFGHGPTVPVPDPFVHHAFARWAAADADAVAVEHEGSVITYGELDRRAAALAARLVREGVRPGDHVGLFVRRSIPMVVGLLGVLKAGAAYVPQDIGLVPRAQLEHVVDTADIRVVLTQEEHADRVPVPNGRRLLTLDGPLPDERPLGVAVVGPDEEPPSLPVGPDDGCYVLFTSGTTGRPNGVKVSHRNVANILLTAPGDQRPAHQGEPGITAPYRHRHGERPEPHTGLDDGVLFERRVFHGLFATQDQKEGMSAFLEKREPRFTGR